MRQIARALILGLVLLAPAAASAGPAEEASAVIDRWAAAFGAGDLDGLMKLYTPDALLLGTTSPKLLAGSEAIRSYLKSHPGIGHTVTVDERRIVVLGETSVMGVGFYTFTLVQDGQSVPRLTRFTVVLTKHGSDWLIAHHHSSMVPPAPLQ